MNLFICKAKVITKPRLVLYKKKALVQMLVCLTNYKRGSSWYYIYTKTRGKLAHQVFDMCMKGNYFIIHGSIKIKFKKINISKHKFKKQKFLVMIIKKIHPLVNN